jgi:patatin-related protein
MKPDYFERQDHDAINAQQEVRFAVVMYGGVSLAIYINGIAQELLRLVRATAGHPDQPDRTWLAGAELQGSEKVYRELGRILDRQEEADRWTIHTRFVVDILSGTSAGGINAVFLAKALANDQRMDQLKQLWLDEGDLAKLLNDRGSAEGRLKEQKDPASLLNSQRMYYKLLYALDGMEDPARPSSATTRSPYASEIDLYVTTTDFHGKPVSLRLADQSISELRHRSVFRFRYRRDPAWVHAQPGATVPAPTNEFHAGVNPWLAVAARCTSSFPLAFEPMCVNDADAARRLDPRHATGPALAEDVAGLSRFLPDYLEPDADPQSDAVGRMMKRSFVDGGYLDNKPFGWAIDAIGRRRTGIPVDRKLLYIEPDPADATEPATAPLAPDALANGLAAFTLARYETIREDLERVLARNRVVERVVSVVGNMEEDMGEQKPPRAPGDDFRMQDVTDMIETEGATYGGYHRLKVSLLTDDIAVMVAAAARLDPTSDAFLAVRYIVQAWRNRIYTLRLERDTDGRPVAGGKLSEHALLMDYDLGFRIRRLSFVIARIDRIYSLDPMAVRILSRQHNPVPASADDISLFRGQLRELRKELEVVLARLKAVRYNLQDRGPENPLRPSFKGQNATLWEAALHRITDEPTEEARKQAAGDFLDTVILPGVRPRLAREFINDTANSLAAIVAEACKAASDDCWKQLGAAASDPAGFAGVARRVVRDYYAFYERYDQMALPVQQASDLGDELDIVDVFRVSPKEATLLSADGPGKLAGNSLGHFGAFLDRSWRWNDILWGRLDGAERIIAALLPGDVNRATRIALTRQAHQAILNEEFGAAARSQVLDQMVNALAANDPEKAPNLRQTLTELQRDEDALYEWFRQHRTLPLAPATSISLMGRSSRVLGRLFDRIAQPHSVARVPARWLARFGGLAAGLVSLATPGSAANLIGRPAVLLLYLFEGLLIALGLIFGRPEVSSVGTNALIVTLGATLAVWVLSDLMRSRKRALLIACLLLAAVLLALAIVGGVQVAGWVSGMVRSG